MKIHIQGGSQACKYSGWEAVYYPVTTRGWMMHFLARPEVSSSGKVFPSLEHPTHYSDERQAPGSYVAYSNITTGRYADLGVKFGFLDPDTLEVKVNPMTGVPYRASDYDDGLLDRSIIRTRLTDLHDKTVEEKRYTQIIE
ncbi:MAG: hypothetical protein IKP00_03455 [Victivallales bacterium]|nr:hypothetical protein [Victivallales bacterium]